MLCSAMTQTFFFLGFDKYVQNLIIMVCDLLRRENRVDTA